MTAPRVDFCTWSGTHHLVEQTMTVVHKAALCGANWYDQHESQAEFNYPYVTVHAICSSCLKAFAATVPEK